jgi:tetratricopeptide (TPR) repeat protein
MAVIVLIAFRFNIGGNMSLSIGFLAGFFLARSWATRSLQFFEVATAVLVITGLYFKIDMNDHTSLMKGLAAIVFFLALARYADYRKGHDFIRDSAASTPAGKPLLIAAAIVALALGFQETRTSILIHKANAALKNNNLQTYASIMEGCAAGHSDPAGAYYDLGRIQLSLGQPEKAVASFKNSISLIYKPEAVEAMLGHLLDSADTEHWSALADFLVERFPENPRYLVVRANGLSQRGNKTGAEKMLQEIIARHPAYYDAYISLGEIKLEQSRIIEARDFFIKAYEIAPASSAYFMADVSRHLNMFAEADRYYLEAINGQPQNIVFRFDHGNNLAAQNRLREAIDAWKSILQYDPNFEPAKTSIKLAEETLAAKKSAILGKSATSGQTQQNEK